MMIEGKEAAVVTEAANVPTATSLGTDTTEIDAVMISTVVRSEELRVSIATATVTARNETEEERGMS